MKVIVVGGTSGIGLAIVRILLARGDRVVLVGRNFDAIEAQVQSNVLCLQQDLLKDEATEDLFMAATDFLGGLDTVIYSSGVMPSVEIDEFNSAKDLEMLQVNCAGAIRWLNLAAARFGPAGHGNIVGIGSVAGDRGRRGQPVYNASKAFLHVYLEALRNRLHRQGVRVTTIKPGPTDTPLIQHLNLKKMMSAEVAARKIVSRIGRSGEFYLSPVHAVIMALIRLTPGPIFRRLNI